MRSELTILEQIDQYLTGQLPPADKAVFEQRIAESPDLANQVAQQKELIRAVNRKALRAQINAAAAGGGGAFGGGMGNLFIGLGSVVAIGLATTAIIYYNSENSDSLISEPLAEENITYVVADSMDSETYYSDSEENLILEQPETIFSSLKNYEEDIKEDEVMNTSVKFRWGGEGEERSSQNGGGAVLSEIQAVDNDNKVNEPKNDRVVNRSARAKYPGGNMAMDNFISKNLNYPRSAWNKAIEGVVRCDFQVTADGVISGIDAKCIKMSGRDGAAFSEMRQLMNKKVENAFINNATHILRTMPTWEPAKNSQGNAIISFQRMYFNYDMDRGILVYQLDEEVGDVIIEDRLEEGEGFLKSLIETKDQISQK